MILMRTEDGSNHYSVKAQEKHQASCSSGYQDLMEVSPTYYVLITADALLQTGNN